MTKIYFIRHAESIANTKGIYQGQSYDTGLSPLGRKQAGVLARRLAGESLGTIFTSPLERAKETAWAIARRQSSGVEIVVLPELAETNHGDWEGKPKETISRQWSDLYRQWQENPSRVTFPNGERFSLTARRTLKLFRKLVKRDKNCAVVTHINIIQIILTHLSGLSLDDIWQFEVQPTAISVIEAQSPLRLVKMNDVSHFSGLQSDLSLHAI